MPSEIVLTNDKHYNDIASAIRNKNGLSTLYKPSEMAEAINALVVGGTITLQDKTVNPSEETQTITHDTGYMGLGEVTVTPILTEVKTVTENGNVYPTTGKYLTRVTVNVPQGGGVNNQNKSVTPTESQQSVTYDDGYTGLGTVTVGAISSTYVGSGITQRSSTDLTASGATITVPAGYYSTQASKAVTSGSAGTPTATKGTVSNHSISVTPSVTNTTGYITGSTKTGTAVTVSASELVSGKKEITANGDNIDVTNYAQVKVAVSGDSPVIDTLSVTPTESEQTFNSSSVTGYKPVTVGAISSTYIGSGITQRSSTDLTASGATVTVPAGYYSEQASKSVSSMTLPTEASTGYSGTLKATVSRSTSHQYINIPTGYNNSAAYYKIEAVRNGSATNNGSYSHGGATLTTGNGIITLTKTISVTPSVNPGYISSGTAGNITVSLASDVNIKAATTYTPGTTDQTISSGTYLTGTQTISGDADLVAGNIKQGVTIFGVEGTYSGAGVSLQTKSVSPTESQQEVTPDSGYDGLSKVTVGAISSTYVGSGIDRNDSTDLTASGATVTVPAGYYAEAASKSITSGSATNSGTASASSATITTGTNTITLSKAVSITPTVSAGYISSGTTGNVTVSLTGSATIDPTPTASGKTVTIPAGYYTESTTKDISTGSATGPSSLSGSSATISTGTNTITLTKTGITTTPTVSAGYVSSATASTATVALTASVTVNPTPTASGATVTIPAGYYSEATSKSVTTGSVSTPTASKGTVSNHSISVTPSVDVTEGYVAGSTKTGTAVTVSASELVSGTLTISSSGTKDVTNYSSASVAAGSATAPASISGTSATVSTGTNTLTLTKTVSVTPSVSAGYISSGTAGNSSVSLTASVTTQGTRTITPTTSNQTITSGTYITGTQTIAGDANLIASNIKSGTSIFGVSGSYAGIDTSDATATAGDIINGLTAYADGRKLEGSLIVQKYYTGSTAPSGSLGNNGDIYFQS